MHASPSAAASWSAAVAVSFSVVATAAVPGGWSKASVKDPEVVAAARFAVASKQADREKAGEEGRLELVEIVAAEQQVVAGMNYRVTLTVKAGADTRKAEAVVWVRAWLDEDERSQLTAWRFVDEKERGAR